MSANKEEKQPFTIVFSAELQERGKALSSPTVCFYNTKQLSRPQRFVWRLKFYLGLTDWRLTD